MPNSTAPDDWFKLFEFDLEPVKYCPECGVREGVAHGLVHHGADLPCGGWRKPCSLAPKADQIA